MANDGAFTALVDLGFDIKAKIRLFLADVALFDPNASDEHDRALGIEGREFMMTKLMHRNDEAEWPIIVEPIKTDALGRWLCRVKFDDSKDLGTVLLERGLAVPYNE